MVDFRLDGDRVCLGGELTFSDVPEVFARLERAVAGAPAGRVEVDLSKLERLDSGGAALLDEVVERGRSLGVEVSIVGASALVEDIRRVLYSGRTTDVPPPDRMGGMEALGAWGYRAGRSFVAFLQLAADTFYWAWVGILRRRGSRKGSFVTQSLLIGVDALPVVSVISLLVGAVLALQSAAQLRQFGANIFVADLIAISMAREMGPLMTAVILAGRSGSAIASEIATMVVTEEVDALRTMAVNPVRYVVVPKFHAITVCMPLLSLIATIVGILGGLVIALFYLGLTPVVYLREAIEVLQAKDIITGLIKSVAFAWIIVVIGAHCGFRVRGGAEGVGRTTTASVVTSIFGVVLADCFFSLLFYF